MIKYRYAFGITYLYFIYTIGGDILWHSLLLGIFMGGLDIMYERKK